MILVMIIHDKENKGKSIENPLSTIILRYL